MFSFVRKLFLSFVSRASSCTTTLVVSDNSWIGALVRTLDAEGYIKSTIFRLHPFTFALFVPVDWIALLTNDNKKSILPRLRVFLTVNRPISSFFFANAKSVDGFFTRFRCCHGNNDFHPIRFHASKFLYWEKSWTRILVSSRIT